MLSRDEREYYLQELVAGRIGLGDLPKKAFADKEFAIRYANLGTIGKYEIVELGAFSDELKSDRDVAIAFARVDYINLRYTNPELRKDPALILAGFNSLEDGYEALNYADDKLKDDATFMMSLIKQDYRAFKYASEYLKMDDHFVSEVLQINGLALRYVFFEELSEELNILKIAVAQNPLSFAYATYDAQDNDRWVDELYQINPIVINFASEKIQEKYKKDGLTTGFITNDNSHNIKL